MENEKLVARRVLFKGFAAAAGAFTLTRLLAACSAKQPSLPNGDDFGTGTPPSSTTPTDGDEYVSADAGTATPVDTGDAPKVPNASWEARVKQLEALGPLYTAAAPGPWAGKERSHVPQVTVSGNKVTVLVQHVMGANGLDAGAPAAMDAGAALDAMADAAKPKDGGADAKAPDAGDAGTTPPSTVIHYITTIFLKSDANVVVGLWEFASTDPAPPTVTFTLPAGVTSVTAYEYCTIHGLWAATAMPIN